MLRKRLSEIVALLPKCRVLADIGCDHGYVGLEALKSNIADSVIFVDISAKSLQKARQNCSEQYSERATFLCQDGIGGLVADCAVIAGMGGLEIISVLTAAQNLPNYLVLQPMRNQRDLRLWLSRGYRIVSDVIFWDGKYYDLILAQRDSAGCTLSDAEIIFGKTNLQNPSPDFVSFLTREQAKYKQILQRCNDAETAGKLDAVNSILATIREEQK